jgi:transposase
MAVPLLSAVMSPKHLIADKAYDADSLRNWLKTRRIKAVIPSKIFWAQTELVLL